MVKTNGFGHVLLAIVVLMSCACGGVQAEKPGVYRIFVLGSNAERMIEVALGSEGLAEKSIVYRFGEHDPDFSPTMGSRMSIDAAGNVFFGGEVTSGSRIAYVVAKLEVKSSSIKIIAEGRMPLVNKKSHVILFARPNPDLLGIFSAKLEENTWSGERFLMMYLPAPGTSPILLGEEGFALYDEATGRTVLISPDGSTMKTLGLEESCIPEMYRSRTQELVCQTADDSRHYYLLNLHTYNARDLDWNERAVPGVYLEKTDSAIYARMERQRYGLKETINYYLYDFETGKTSTIKENFWASSRSMVLVTSGGSH